MKNIQKWLLRIAAVLLLSGFAGVGVFAQEETDTEETDVPADVSTDIPPANKYFWVGHGTQREVLYNDTRDLNMIYVKVKSDSPVPKNEYLQVRIYELNKPMYIGAPYKLIQIRRGEIAEHKFATTPGAYKTVQLVNGSTYSFIVKYWF